MKSKQNEQKKDKEYTCGNWLSPFINDMISVTIRYECVETKKTQVSLTNWKQIKKIKIKIKQTKSVDDVSKTKVKKKKIAG